MLTWPLRLFDTDARACRDSTSTIRIEACTRAIDSAKWYFDNGSWAYSYRGNAYRKRGETDLAIADYDEAFRSGTRSPTLFYSRGLAYQDKKDLRHAIEDYGQAIYRVNSRRYPVSKSVYLSQRAIAYNAAASWPYR